MRAILSPYDKRGLDTFARGLLDLGFEIFGTDGTVRFLAGTGVVARNVSELTGHPEILGGRVKTLHPAIHAGLLADRGDPGHLSQLGEFGYGTIDLVACNLYPFQATIEKPDVTLPEAVEQIDIGGVTLLRAAAKNFVSVIPIVDPADYADIVDRIATDAADEAWRRSLAAKAFQHVAKYDTLVAGFLRGNAPEFPDELTVALEKSQDLRYGENPHQRAALYRQIPSIDVAANLAGARQLHGRELSFNNILDVDAAFGCANDFAAVTVAIIKHGNPCGLARASTVADAYRLAHDGDPLSSFGGAVGLNRVVDVDAAKLIAESHYDDIIAPGYTDEALDILRRKRHVRILELDPGHSGQAAGEDNPSTMLDFRRITGGFLIQTPDALAEDDLTLRQVTERAVTEAELSELRFAWRAVKHVRSNAIVLAKNQSLVGVGAGQMSRVDSVEIALRKAGGRAAGSVLASDAFFSHPDGPELAAKAGITAIIQPGDALHDEDVIRVANEHNLAMVFTGRRHFRH